MWFMNENLGGMARWHWAQLLSSQVLGLGGPMEMRPQMYLCRVCTRPPLLVKPPKRHEQGPQGPT